MKKYLFYISIVSLSCCFSCKDEEIIDSKSGESIDPVTNLDYSISEEGLILTWDMPSDFPDDVIQPVSVQISISEDGNNGGSHVLEGAPEQYIFSTFDAAVTYRFTVKVMASVDTSAPHESDLRYSLGNTVQVDGD